jgi:hypothetical protein
MRLSQWMFLLFELTDSVLYTVTTTSFLSLVSFYVIVYWFVRGNRWVTVYDVYFHPNKQLHQFFSRLSQSYHQRAVIKCTLVRMY